MRKLLRFSLILLLITAAWSACQRASEDRTEELSTTELDSLAVTYRNLTDSLNAGWDTLARNEEQKLANLQRLLTEITFTPNYNKLRYDSLKAHLNALSTLQLKPEQMTDEQIDRYDSASQAVKTAIVNMAQENPAFKQFPLMGQLVDSIEAGDQRVILYRVRYDNYAKDLNHFLDVHQEQLARLDTLTTPRKRKLFQLGE
jgi:hypothetical protein